MAPGSLGNESRTARRRADQTMDVSYRGNALSSEVQLAPGLGHQRASGICKNHMLEMLHRAGPVAASAERSRPLELGFCRLGRRREVLHDALPERDRGA